nr:hypothetical protein [Morganella morganii]
MTGVFISVNPVRSDTVSMRICACQAANIAENNSVVRWPPQPGRAGYRLL